MRFYKMKEYDLKQLLENRKLINQKIQELMLFKSITSKSKLTEADVERIGEKIKKAITEKHK